MPDETRVTEARSVVLRPTAPPPSLGSWTLAWVVAEGIGMTAAAGAARAATAMTDDSASGARVAALGVVVAGGLIEGLALGILPGRLLGAWLPGFRLRAWVVVTVVFAGLGWAAASAPSVLAGEDDGSDPHPALVLFGAAGLGLVMGLLLGSAQALVLRGTVTRARPWVVASVAGWIPAMVVIFAGATRPEESWGTLTVVLTGTVTGLLAGSVLGLVTRAFLPALTGGPSGAAARPASAPRRGDRQ